MGISWKQNPLILPVDAVKYVCLAMVTVNRKRMVKVGRVWKVSVLQTFKNLAKCT